ncbi:MAG: peptide chain release factor N(5)-glutamine methyltransferase [Cytophagales bacterium]|nr:peptide chain release factor N(5)-glutamine methyltransferase [Cytophagales bacterium]
MLRARDYGKELARAIGDTYPSREAQSIANWVLEDLFNIPPHRFHERISFSEVQRLRWDDIIVRLLAHEPIQYILGYTWFYGRCFEVDPRVLIPRPETEDLCRAILTRDGGFSENCKVWEIGTGSGAIALTMSSERSDWQILATDISSDALRVARKNQLRYPETHSVQFAHHDIRVMNDGVSTFFYGDGFDIMLSNPPYVPFSERIPERVRKYEPGIALYVPDSHPLCFYEEILRYRDYLRPNGMVCVEIHNRYANEVAGLFSQKNLGVEIHQDLHGRDRILIARNLV